MVVGAEVVAAPEQQPAGLLENRVAALAFQAAGFLGADLVEGFVHIGDDVETVEDMQGVRASLANELEVGFPHVRADEADMVNDLFV